MPILHGALVGGQLAVYRGEPEDAAVLDGTAHFERVDAIWALELFKRVREAGQRGIEPGVFAAPSLAGLARIAQHALACVLRQEIVPDLVLVRDGEDARYEARWKAMPRPAARDAIEALARSLPGAVFAAVDGQRDVSVDRVRHVSRFVDWLADAAARIAIEARAAAPSVERGTIHDRWLVALGRSDSTVSAPADALDALMEQVASWQDRLTRPRDARLRLLVRLEEPDDAGRDDPGSGIWYLRYLLQARDEPSTVIELAKAWNPHGHEAAALERLGFLEGPHALAPLAEAALVCEPIAESLHGTRPVGCELSTQQVHEFLRETLPLLEQAGIGVLAPGWWQSRRGRFTLSLRARPTTFLTGGKRTTSSLNLASLVSYDWRAALGETSLSHAELRELAAQRSGLVRVRGMWVELDEAEVAKALAHVEHLQRANVEQPAATVGELVAMSVGDVSTSDGLAISGIDAEGEIAQLLASLDVHDVPDPPPIPAGLDAELRPYQQRGFAWLCSMADLGLGACLADDMGLGKTVQLIASVLHDIERDAGCGPTLIVCPTTVLGTWLGEFARFAPSARVVLHHGASRPRGEAFADDIRDVDVVLTSYALLARDRADLERVAWRRVCLDEAQNIKNPGTDHARAARALTAEVRVALTGTPVENHVGDLWAIMQFLNPGLLGSQIDFRRKYMLPIQTGAYPEAAERLARLTRPFVLRRLKTDTSVIADLPDKLETMVPCTLTTEQAALYQTILDDTQRILRGRKPPAGIDRRGTILATLSKLKQACNHPAQLLADNSTIAGRSGKLTRLEDLLERILGAEERALVFTQFVGMAEIITRHVRETFGREVLLLHGGTSRVERERIVARFQSGDNAPPVLVLSLKAGGSGLNLTAATHVIHYDRWWNPAVEDQASDRAFRIGQTRDVQIHTLVTQGTVEERIDQLLAHKRTVAEQIVGSGETWIANLPDGELLELLALREQTLLQPGELAHTGKEWRRARLG